MVIRNLCRCSVCNDFVFDSEMCMPCLKNKLNKEIRQARLDKNIQRGLSTGLQGLPLSIVMQSLNEKLPFPSGNAARGYHMCLSDLRLMDRIGEFERPTWDSTRQAHHMRDWEYLR